MSDWPGVVNLVTRLQVNPTETSLAHCSDTITRASYIGWKILHGFQQNKNWADTGRIYSIVRILKMT